MSIKVLIIGQGLAGTVLGETFSKNGALVHFVDQGFEKASSLVAAGMYNPVVFKRITKGWMADEFLPFAKVFYKEFEERIGGNFCENYDILKYFPNQDYRDQWIQAIENGNEYVSKPEDTFRHPHIINEFGYGRVTNVGRVVLTNMLHRYREILVAENRMKEESFDLEHLDLKGHYLDIQFDKIIFCQGHLGLDNPFFGELPLRKTKGELLKIKAPDLDTSDLLNRGFFMVPLGNNEYLIGSTYDWKDHTYKVTEKAKSTLLDKLSKLYTGPIEILEHTMGIRPTVKDRRPLIGYHEEHANVGIFNGLGTKGVLLAPYLANQFVRHTLYGEPIHPEASIKRFN